MKSSPGRRRDDRRQDGTTRAEERGTLCVLMGDPKRWEKSAKDKIQ